MTLNVKRMLTRAVLYLIYTSHPHYLFTLLVACASLFLYLFPTVCVPSWTPVSVDSVLLEDDLSKQKPVA